MPPRKKKRTSSAPVKAAEPDVVHLAGTMQEAAAAPHFVRLVGAGGLATPSYYVGVGEAEDVEPADLLSAVEYALRTPPATAKSKKDGREPTCEEKPFVAEPKKLGEGAPASFLDGASASDVATRRRADRWTPRELSVFLQTRYQLQELRGSRPKCCFCQSMLTYITSSAFERALFRQAYGPMWLADGDIVLVSRPLMEAAANRAARALLAAARRVGRVMVLEAAARVNVRVLALQSVLFLNNLGELISFQERRTHKKSLTQWQELLYYDRFSYQSDATIFEV